MVASETSIQKRSSLYDALPGPVTLYLYLPQARIPTTLVRITSVMEPEILMPRPTGLSSVGGPVEVVVILDPGRVEQESAYLVYVACQ